MRLFETDAILYDIFINFFSLKINFFHILIFLSSLISS